MLRINCLVILCLFTFNAEILSESDEFLKVFVTVYYESQCPDSRSFIVEQLQPTLKSYHEFIDVKLIPFGKAHNINRKAFQCQHGPTECMGNVVQSCTLDLMQGRTDIDRADYVACEMNTQAGTKLDMQCVYEADVDEEDVYQCATSAKGLSLQLDDEYYTKIINPTFVPTITFDDVFDQEIQDASIRDLPGALCLYRKDLPPCAEYFNKMAMGYVLL
ncbi:gamma-interferon-inducible lysosomal thiol reductase-like protein [Anticarsia gemmatalis]|uniref:gamma-interferon-inducible lysosomal thiol reductase-like protein n=1 Tax=Anticarsia gemmatalis TaxID=129554 RepID=UPI003F77091A